MYILCGGIYPIVTFLFFSTKKDCNSSMGCEVVYCWAVLLGKFEKFVFLFCWRGRRRQYVCGSKMWGGGGNKRKSRSRSNPIQSKPTKRRKKRSTSKKLIVRLSEEPTCFVREMEGIWWAELAWFFLFRGKTVNIHVQIHDSQFGCFPCFYGKMNKGNYFFFFRFFWGVSTRKVLREVQWREKMMNFLLIFM